MTCILSIDYDETLFVYQLIIKPLYVIHNYTLHTLYLNYEEIGLKQQQQQEEEEEEEGLSLLKKEEEVQEEKVLQLKSKYFKGLKPFKHFKLSLDQISHYTFDINQLTPNEYEFRFTSSN